MAIKTPLILILSLFVIVFCRTGWSHETHDDFQNYDLKLTENEKAWLREHPVIRLGVDAHYAPYSHVDETGKFKGVAADYIQQISNMLGIRMEMVPDLSWLEIIQAAKDKTIDVIATASYRPEREEFLNFTKGYIPTPLVIMTRKDDFRVANRNDLRKLKVALVKGYNVSKTVLQEFGEIDVYEVSTSLEGLNAVSSGKADAYVGVLGINVFLSQNHGITNLKVASAFDLETNYQRLGIRKDWPTLTTILDKALNAIPDLEKRKVLQKWVPVQHSRFDPVSVDLTEEERKWLTEHPVIRTALKKNWAPIEFVAEDGSYQGMSNDYLKKIENMLNVRFEIQGESSWHLILEAFEQGKLDFLPAFRMTPERSVKFDATETYLEFPSEIFTGPNVPFIGNLIELNNKVVGIIDDDSVGETLAKDYPQIQVKRYTNTPDALEKLSRGEIDAFIGNILVTGYYIGKLGYTHLKVAGESPYKYVQSFSVRKDWPIFTRILNKALKSIPDSEHRAIYQRWISVRYDRGFDYSSFREIVEIIILFAVILFFLFARWNRRIAESENQLRTIVETVVDGIFTLDDKGIIKTFNPAAERIFGYAAKEVEGQNFTKMLIANRTGDSSLILHNYIRGKDEGQKGVEIEVVGFRQDGSKFDMAVALRRTMSSGSVMYTGVLRDITERKRVDRIKDEFISTVSHELRTPLTSIRGAIGIVVAKTQEMIPKKLNNMLLMAERNSERLALLIDDILDMEKLETGLLSLNKQEVDMVQLTQRAVHEYEGFAANHNIEIEIDLNAESAVCAVDDHRILQVFANLISNAVKFSPTGSAILVTAEVKAGNCQITVKDRGAGIPQHFQPRVFERFAQADSTDSREKGGTGLGLSIAKKIVELHGGTIGYTTGSEKGTTFYFSLPLLKTR